MKNIPAPLLAHIQGERITLCICWLVEKRNGGVVRGTDHDRDVVITTGAYAGTYRTLVNVTGTDLRSGSDMSVDNMEVHGAESNSPDDGITWAEIDAGFLNGARVTVLNCNWQRPDDGQVVMKRGFMGTVTRDSDHNLKTEIRGLGQVLAQQIGRVLSDQCDVVRFGDARCGFDVDSITGYGLVVNVASQREFTIEAESPPFPEWTTFPPGGEATFLTGENATITVETKSATLADGQLTIELYEEISGEIEVGDQVEFIPGCDRLYSTCKNVWNNLVNFRGHGVFVPGPLAIMRGNTVIGNCERTLPDGTRINEEPTGIDDLIEDVFDEEP